MALLRSYYYTSVRSREYLLALERYLFIMPKTNGMLKYPSRGQRGVGGYSLLLSALMIVWIMRIPRVSGDGEYGNYL
jgi:hypothetical protein